MKKFIKSGFFLLFVGITATVCITMETVPTVLAYMTDIAERMDNKFTIALDSTSVIVEKYPDPKPGVDDNNIASYEKSVQVANTGYIDEYVRVRLDFTDSDIESKTSFSWDGVNSFSVVDYRNHLPAGWSYNADDGYYYYSKIVQSGDWATIKKNLRYDERSGQYFYKNGQNIMEAAIITTPLIRYVKTVFENPKDMRSYSLNVYSESCPFYFGNDYSTAWQTYLN